MGSAAVESSAAPVPAPAALVAELIVAKPDVTWTTVRDLVGFPATALPASSGLMLGTLLGWSGAVSGQFSGDVPLLGVLLEDAESDAQVAAVVGVHVRSGPELVATHTKGASAGYTSRRDDASGVTLLEPVPGKAPTDYSVGVVGNYLVVGLRQAHVVAAGPYLAKTLSKKPPPPEPIVVVVERPALSKNVARLLDGAWTAYRTRLERQDAQNRARHGGRAPDFGDPGAALQAVEGVVARAKDVLGSADRARFVVTPSPGRVEATLTVEAATGGEAARAFGEMVTGEAAPLLALPGRTLAAILTRSNAASREASASTLAKGLGGVLADRLEPASQAKVQQAATSLSSAHGDWTTYALLAEPALLVRSPVADAKALDKAVKSLFGLLEVRAFAEPLRQFVGDVTTKHSTLDVPGVAPDVRRMLVGIKPAPMRLGGSGATTVALEPPPFEVLWTVRDGVAHGVIAGEGARTLVESAAPGVEPSATLGGDPRASAALGRIPTPVAYVVYAQPLRLGMLGRAFGADAPSSPVVVSLGGSATTWSLRAEIAKEVVGEIARQSVTR